MIATAVAKHPVRNINIPQIKTLVSRFISVVGYGVVLGSYHAASFFP
jgi:hypothetical protein